MEKSITAAPAEQPAPTPREPVEVIAQINKLTQDNKIHWRVLAQNQDGSENDAVRIQAVYEAEYKGNTLRLTRRTKKMYLAAEGLTFGGLSAFRHLTRTIYRDKDTQQEYYWQSELLLQLLDPSGLIVWSPRYVSILDGLETSVQHQTTQSAYKNFVEEIFADE